MTPENEKKIAELYGLLAKAVIETVKAVGAGPESMFYLGFQQAMPKLSFSAYQVIVEIAIATGKIRRVNNQLEYVR